MAELLAQRNITERLLVAQSGRLIISLGLT